MYSITLNQARDEVIACIGAQLTPVMLSSPGVGKSSVMQQIAKDFRLKLIDVRLSQCTPEDLNGFPMRQGNKATFTPFDIFPLEGEEIPEGYDGWMLFFDEITSATKPVQAAAYKVILDRMVGSYKLHPNVAVVAAGNKATDNAIVNKMSTALQSRMIHYEIEVSAKDWLEHAIAKAYDYRITSFITYMPSKLMDFRPDHQDHTFPCPRTWEFLSRLLKDRPIGPELGPRVAGTIGQGVAVEFITFAQEFDRLPKLHDILTAPETVPVPPEMSTKYATMSMLIENFTMDNLKNILTYVQKFDIELQIIFSRGAVARNPKIRSEHPEFGQYLVKMVRYLS